MRSVILHFFIWFYQFTLISIFVTLAFLINYYKSIHIFNFVKCLRLALFHFILLCISFIIQFCFIIDFLLYLFPIFLISFNFDFNRYSISIPLLNNCNLVFIFKLAWIFNFQPLYDMFFSAFQNNKWNRFANKEKVTNFGFEPTPVISLLLLAQCNVPVRANDVKRKDHPG